MTSVSYSAITSRYHLLPQSKDNIQLRYIWLDGNGYDLRTKSKPTDVIPKTVDEVPLWTYCGQTCGHMKLTADSDCWLKPVLLCKDPFRGGDNKLVFCVPIKYEIKASINRLSCESTLNKLNETKGLSFTISQPYLLINPNTRRPIGWPIGGNPGPKGPNYCGVGANKVNGRDIDEAFYKACLYSGIPIMETQAGDLLSTWSFKIGPSNGLSIADQLWMTRYILHYIGEEFNVVVWFRPTYMTDVELGQHLKVCFGTDSNVQTEKPQLNENKNHKNSENLINTEKELLQEISFASDIDPYVAIESIIENNVIENRA